MKELLSAKSELNWELDCVTLITVKNKDVSSAKSFEFENKFYSVRSLINKSNNRGPRMDSRESLL